MTYTDEEPGLQSETEASNDPLSARVSEYVAGNRDATPDEVLREAALNESRRAQ
jgi:hypothetical protein